MTHFNLIWKKPLWYPTGWRYAKYLLLKVGFRCDCIAIYCSIAAYSQLEMYTHMHTHTHTTEIHDAFALFDKRGDNKIDATQIGDIMRALGLNPTEAELKKIVKEVDPNSKHTQA